MQPKGQRATPHTKEALSEPTLLLLLFLLLQEDSEKKVMEKKPEQYLHAPSPNSPN